MERLRGLEAETARLRFEGDEGEEKRRGLETEVQRLRGFEEEEGRKRRGLEEEVDLNPTPETRNPKP